MNNKGQMEAVGMIIMAFVGIIVCLSILVPTVSTAVGEMTSTRDVPVTTLITCANATTVTLQGKSITNFAPINRSTGDAVTATNYTVNNNVILSDGTIGATVTWKQGAYLKTNDCNVSYTYQPLGYIPEAGARGIASIIIIFLAIAVFVIALVPTMRNPAMEMIGLR